MLGVLYGCTFIARVSLRLLYRVISLPHIPSFDSLQFPAVVVSPIPFVPSPSVAVASIHAPVFVVPLVHAIVLPVEALVVATLSVASFPSFVFLVVVSACDGPRVLLLYSFFLLLFHSLPLAVLFCMVASLC